MFPKYYNNNTSANPERCPMSNFIGQNEVNMADEPLKVEQPILKSSSEIDDKVNDQYRIFPRNQIDSDGDKFSFSKI